MWPFDSFLCLLVIRFLAQLGEAAQESGWVDDSPWTWARLAYRASEVAALWWEEYLTSSGH